ncbi:MAG: alpha-galactosidase [Lachnospiraceae bacterium]|nr:alpha-galactosidase [Lachnospiraceae bacterium]
MNILYDDKTGVFSLTTANTLYQMKADSNGVLLHLFYGEKTASDMSYLIHYTDRGFSGNPFECAENRGYSLDTLPQEYSGNGVGDHRLSSAQAVSENGSRSVDLRFADYQISKGREALHGLPYVREHAETETLRITLRDSAIGLEVELLYHVFPAQDVIVRSTRLINNGKQALKLEKAASACIDFLYGKYDVVHFYGRHCMERIPERLSLPRGIVSFGSRRGMSSHHSNPFVILCDHYATENSGDCYGCMLMYSGNHAEEIEVDQAGSTRLVSGIHPEGFSWLLPAGETFETPEAILSFSAEGLNGLSRHYHDILRQQVIPSRWQQAERPVLINSWEAAEFDFDGEKILRFASSAKEMGIGMLVLDDGWFGKRDDDRSGLGDWIVNEKKLGCSMKDLSDQIHAMGLQFGLWFEPEMVSEDSDLYRAHPDWVLKDPGRKPMLARNQLVLDMSRQEVTDYLFDAVCAILDQTKIEYIKWDFNRSLANVYSSALPASRQGEVPHRFIMGTYQLLERVLKRYPDLMIEGCAGGGGRFDAGMLFYCPQIWCSDDTDAIERLEIQRGTSYGYPVSTMGSHVSAVPNPQTGRSVPLKTRGIVAQSGTFGYELDPEKLSGDEKEMVVQQVGDYHRYAELIREGNYYRLTELGDDPDFISWMFASKDGEEALVNFVMVHVRANGPFPFIKLRGLLPEANYRLEGTDRVYTGAALMHGGLSFPQMKGEYPSVQLYFVSDRA